MYPQELAWLFEVAGFRVVERYDGWDRAPFGAGSTRNIVVGEKAGG